jgi:hypothetical protein
VGPSAYTVFPFWRGVLAGARCGTAVLFASLAILHSGPGSAGPAEAVPFLLSAALLTQAAIFAALFIAPAALYLASAVLVAALALAGPLSPEASGGAPSGFVAALLSGVVLPDDHGGAVVRELFTVAGGPLAGGG